MQFGTISRKRRRAQIIVLPRQCHRQAVPAPARPRCSTADPHIDLDERIINLRGRPNCSSSNPFGPLETRPPNLEGGGEVTMRELVGTTCACARKASSSAKSVVRGIHLLQAMNTGHDGSMGTLHANNPREALSRLNR